MERLTYSIPTDVPAQGDRAVAVIGVVGSGNLEVLVERQPDPGLCVVEIATTAHGFSDIWQAVAADFVRRRAAGGLRLAINDGGARPDTVALRLAQAARLIAEEADQWA